MAGAFASLAAAAFVHAARADEGTLVRTPVVFPVANPQEGGAEREIHGFRIDPPCAATSVVLLQHGLSYTAEAWDFDPGGGYSYARTLASAGYAVVAIDRLGYGASHVASGYAVSVDTYADMAHQIVLQLRREFDHIVIGGHSAGCEASELAAGLLGDVDALIAMGYHQFPSPELLTYFTTGDVPRALLHDYEYFLGTPSLRAKMFYTAEADPQIVQMDTAAAVPTPSGEILTIELQPSRVLAPFVDVPVFLQLAEGDRLFPVEYASLAAASFVLSPSVTVDIVPQAGHTYMLHPSGPPAAERIAAWLHSLPQTPRCQ